MPTKTKHQYGEPNLWYSEYHGFFISMITFHMITLFPETIETYANSSILGRAQKKKLIAVKYYNPRDFAVSSKKGKTSTYAERRVDDRPYGGGPGMVIEALPVIRAIEKAVGKKFINPKLEIRNKSEARNSNIGNSRSKIKIIFFSPGGKQFTNQLADSFKKYSDIVLVSGRYEGIDARVKKAFPVTDISIGSYVLTGGELPAMVVIDAITRRIPGALGDDLSIEEARIASPDVYTRPEVILYKGKEYRVPKILLSGHHKKMDEWKKGRKQRKIS